MQTAFANLTMAPDLAADQAQLRLIESATRLLESVVGRSAGRIRVAWESAEPGWVRLRLDDPVAEASQEIPVSELTNEVRLRHRLSHQWSHLLGRRVDVLLEPVLHPTDSGLTP